MAQIDKDKVLLQISENVTKCLKKIEQRDDLLICIAKELGVINAKLKG